MTDLEPRRPTSITTRAPRLQTLPRPVVIGGGLIVGTLGLIALGGAAVAVFNVALTLVTVVLWAVVIAAFWFLWPALVLTLKIGRIKAEDAVTRANPLEALELQRSEFAQTISAAQSQLAGVAGQMESVQRTFETTRADLTPDRVQVWTEQLQKRREAYDLVVHRIDEMKAQLSTFDRQLKTARAEITMADADTGLGNALSRGKQAPDLSRTSQVAFDSINQQIGSSAAALDLALRNVKV